VNSETLVTILSKGEMYSLLSLISEQRLDASGNLTCVNAVAKLDPREDQPLVKPFSERREALAQYRQAIATSLERGWRVAWQGEPLFG
jgi:hypothetical protein